MPMMIEWNNFSAFDGVYELEHVVDLLHDWSAAGADVAKLNSHRNRYDYETGEKSYLWKRLGIQAAETEAIIEKEKPGLYPRTDIADNFNKLFFVLDDVAEKPYLLASELPDIVLRLHKVLIYAHDIFDPEHRKELINKEITKAKVIDSETLNEAVEEQKRRLQSERGKKSKRGPSAESGVALVKEVRTISKKRAWTNAWDWLVSMAEDEKALCKFEMISHQADVVFYRINGTEKSLKKTTFVSYWQKKD